jgi:hypothetical protein
MAANNAAMAPKVQSARSKRKPYEYPGRYLPRWSIGMYGRCVGPVYTCRGR